ncbi:MAG: efflux RND transporter permease subunit [Fidelibacterota bacterium]|nr:MAG: efflux RND transporter permease subunit [Candidatus Neomarinimicrobiota bacterium]
MRSIFQFFAQRHMLAYLITIMTIILGLSTLIGIKRGVYPEVEFGIMRIVTRYPGASPEDVELNVTNKIEKEVQTVAGLDRVTSVSMENVSVIFVFVDIDAPDQDDIKNEIREAVRRVTDFPVEVTESPLIIDMKQSDNPVIEVGLTGDLPYRELREIARLFEKKLKRVPGVSSVDRAGYRAREIKVEVSPEAVKDYQIPLREVIAAIQSRNIRGTTGAFESYTSEKDLVTLAQFNDPMEVGDVIIRSTFDGPVVRVRDLAVIRDDFEDLRLESRINGKTAISLIVHMSEVADVIRTCDAVKELITRENQNLPEGVKLVYSNDTSRYVRNSFDVVLKNGLIGLILLMALLPVFLNFRTAFWVAMGIPVAFLGTIFFLPLFGSYLDTITLAGMVLVIGIIVDDAIIIAENISRRREQGDSPVDAAVNGIHEVFRPVVTTVLTTFLVFAPMFFMPGLFGKYIVPIPLAISLALFISLAEAAVALPAHLVTGMRRRPIETTGRNWFRVLSRRYQKIVLRLLTLRYILLPVFILALIGSLWYAGNFMKFIMFPAGAAQQFYALIELPIGTPLRTTSEKVREIEEIIAELPDDELASFVTRIGTNFFENTERENSASMMVTLTPFTERARSAEEIVEALRQKTDQLAGFTEIVYSIETGGPPVGKPISLRIIGSDDDLRAALTDSVVAFLAITEGVKDINRDDKGGKDQVEIIIDYDQLSRVGLTVAEVAQNVRLAYDGEIVTSVRYGDEDVAFRVIMEERARRQLSYLDEILIPNRQGRLIPLKEVAVLKSAPGKTDLRHFDGERTVTVEADVDQEVVTPLEVTRALFDHFNVDRDWPGMQLITGGEIIETQESMAGLFRTLLIAVIGVFFLLILLFNSLTQPILVMMAIPFGITGVIIAFALHGEPFSFVAMMGIIGLSGVVVNDSLVLVNHVNDLKREKRDANIREIIAEGTADRLRAIIITTLTTVAALLPLAYGIGGTALFMAPMALALGWGLVFATPLTLVLVPCLYMIGQDIHGVFKRRRR